MKQAALMYDFDRTLSVNDMKDTAFFPLLNVSPEDFWAQADALARTHQMDQTLAYMYLMITACRNRGLRLTRELLTSCGPDIELFPGVTEWFERISAYALSKGIQVKHYLISAGIDEIIRGCPIASAFDDIFACRFAYDAAGEAVWPALFVSHTMKTQFLFRISKGVHDVCEDDALNRPMPAALRPVPFERMIYIGDGITDVPAMQVVRAQGGRAAAVYGAHQTAQGLLDAGRVDIAVPADYREGSMLDTFVKDALAQMAQP